VRPRGPLRWLRPTTRGAPGRSARSGAACTLDGAVTSPTREVAGYALDTVLTGTTSDGVDGEAWTMLGHARFSGGLRGKTEER
jgi:hypothetical protein